MAIGHVRYSTTGGGSWENAQPVWRDDGRELALAHNGNLTNAVELWNELKEARDRLPRHLRLGDHRGAALLQRRQLHRGRGRRRDAAAAGRLLDRGDDQARDRRLPRPARGAAALAGAARRALRRRLGELRLRHHRRRAAARGAPGRDGLADRARPRDAPGGQGRPPGALRLRAHLLLPPRQPPRGQGAAAGARADGRDPLARGAGRGRPGDLGARLRQPGRRRLRARLGAAPRRRPDQEPLRRPHLHPARPGAAQARPAAEVQPAAGDRLRPADRRRRRLDRARQHDAPDRRHAARRRRERGPPADLGAADPPPLPLRGRHVDARGDDRPRADDRGDRRRARRRLARLPLDGGRLRGDRHRRPRTTATPASPAATRSATPRRRTASSRSRTSPSSRARAAR